jgi:prepilin-type N-terminal cleavage/methylation domain-containing protein
LGIELNQYNNRGFTLVELIVVVAIFVLILSFTIPRITSLGGNERKESVIFKAYIEAITDNSFVNCKTNYLCINLLNDGDQNKDSKFSGSQYTDTNALVVYELIDGEFKQSKSQLLKARNFSSSFALSEVILEGGRSVTSGNVLIPFYSDGSSESFKIKILSDDSTIILSKDKNSKRVYTQNEI